MINEKKLIERLKGTPALNNVLQGLIRIIEGQPKVGEWIPCSEMLPPIDMSCPNAKDYLVYYEHGDYDVASYSNINRFWHEHITEPYWNCEQYCKVIAWMPLPEAYKE